MVEYQLPKLATGVRFPSLAPILRSKIDPERDMKSDKQEDFIRSEGPKSMRNKADEILQA